MQSQVVCSGCRSMLLYPRGASNVCCALCNTLTPAPAPGMDMAQLICGGCRTLLAYSRGATSVRCSCCHTVNLVPVSNQFAHVNCGNCRTTLMYPYGAPSVKCAVCHYVTNVNMGNMRVPLPANRPNGTVGTMPSTSTAMPQPQTQTVVVENPMSVDESGKLVKATAHLLFHVYLSSHFPIVKIVHCPLRALIDVLNTAGEQRCRRCNNREKIML